MRTFSAVIRFIGRNGKRVAVTIAGFILVLVGLAGLVLPVLPGWALIFVGLAVLATEYVWARRALETARRQARRAARRVRGKKVDPGRQAGDSGQRAAGEEPEYPSA